MKKNYKKPAMRIENFESSIICISLGAHNEQGMSNVQFARHHADWDDEDDWGDE